MSLVFLESVVAVLYSLGVTLNAEFDNREYIVSYLIKPCLTVLATILLSNWAGLALSRRFGDIIRSWTILIALVVVVTEIIAFHHGSSVVYVLYVLPIVSSLVYEKRKMLLVIYILSIIMYLLVFIYIVNFIPPDEYRHSYIDVLGNIAILTSVYVLCRMVLTRVEELIATAVSESVLRKRLSHEITLDSMTGLYNHATFYRYLNEHIIAYTQDKSKNFALILIDIDNFKKINDIYGHDTGDQVILRLVDTIKEHLKSDDHAFRYGGEEFVVLTPSPQCAFDLAEAIRLNFSRQVFPNIPHNVTVSIGISTYSGAFKGKGEFFTSTDNALYEAKRLGKNRTCVAEKDAGP